MTSRVFVCSNYQTDVGLESQKWLLKEVESVAGNVASVAEFSHNNFEQSSIIAKIAGDGSTNDTVIIGAHLDSTAGFDGVAPGADDDGTVSVIYFRFLWFSIFFFFCGF